MNDFRSVCLQVIFLLRQNLIRNAKKAMCMKIARFHNVVISSITTMGPSWLWMYGSWIYNYLCNQCLSPLTLWNQTLLRWSVLHTTLCDQVCQWLAAGRWCSPGTRVSSTNKTDRHDITEILVKVALSTIKPLHYYKELRFWSWYIILSELVTSIESHKGRLFSTINCPLKIKTEKGPSKYKHKRTTNYIT